MRELPPVLRAVTPAELAERMHAERRGEPFVVYVDGEGRQRIVGRTYVIFDEGSKVTQVIERSGAQPPPKSAGREEGEITLAGFRDRMGTSRKYAQVWLEYSDAAGVTRRVGDARILARRYR